MTAAVHGAGSAGQSSARYERPVRSSTSRLTTSVVRTTPLQRGGATGEPAGCLLPEVDEQHARGTVALAQRVGHPVPEGRRVQHRRPRGERPEHGDDPAAADPGDALDAMEHEPPAPATLRTRRTGRPLAVSVTSTSPTGGPSVATAATIAC